MWVGVCGASATDAVLDVAGNTACVEPMIPAEDSNAEVMSEVTVGVDGAKLVYIQPHMHLQGKDDELRLTYPTSQFETVFRGTWDFN